MSFRALFVSIAAAALALPALAQSARPPAPVRSEEWYQGQLVELAEVLGGSHYLRITCDGRADQRWRDYMRGVLDREPVYRDQLVEAFNRGYRQEESRFAECDRAATQAEAELRAQGLRVAGGLSARYGH